MDRCSKCLSYECACTKPRKQVHPDTPAINPDSEEALKLLWESLANTKQMKVLIQTHIISDINMDDM